MSEGEAFRRIAAARLVKRFPSLLARIESGALHLTAIVLLRDHFTDANVDELADAAARKTKREVEEIIARRAPRPDVASTIRKLPAPVTVIAPTLQLDASPSKPVPEPEPPSRARVEPLSEDRYEVQFTASGALREKLERARNLMRHREPSGDVAVVVERALDALLAKLEKERFGKTSRPQRRQRSANASHVWQAARRGRRRSETFASPAARTTGFMRRRCSGESTSRGAFTCASKSGERRRRQGTHAAKVTKLPAELLVWEADQKLVLDSLAAVDQQDGDEKLRGRLDLDRIGSFG